MATAGTARADEFLRGPHPFLKDNALAIVGGYGLAAGSDSPSGVRAVLDYGYRVGGSLWFDLRMGYLSGSCKSGPSTCGAAPGDAAEVLAGVTGKLRMSLPVVPYGTLAAGVLYSFPDQGARAAGPALRAAIGARYFLYDWLGLGLEAAFLVGRAGRQVSGEARWSQTLDLGAGAEFQF